MNNSRPVEGANNDHHFRIDALIVLSLDSLTSGEGEVIVIQIPDCRIASDDDDEHSYH